MRKIVLLCLFAFPFALSAQYQQHREAVALKNTSLEEFVNEQRVLFNFDWKFMLQTELNQTTDFASPTLDDTDWRTLDLPHDFQFEQPWTENGGGARGFKPMCEGWYRKTFNARTEWKGKRVTLDFGGIIYLGDVYLNGYKIASTDYGYVGLEADLTPYLLYDRPNVVAVYASIGPQKGSRWYTGGGLFRDVHLQVQNPTHIARHGIFITTPEVSGEKATVQVQVEVDGWQKHNVTIRTRLLDAAGRVVGTTQSGMPEHTNQTCTEVKLPVITLDNPWLWSTDTPYLYSADVVVEADGMVVDSLREEFGVRKIEFSPEYGFKLNGEKVFLKGISNHHDMGALGAASFDAGIERMMLRLKEFGFNHIRCSHNPYSESFTKIADRLGILIVDELIDKWSDNDYWGGRQPFTNLWPQMVTEWVKRDRNSPSVIMWSLGNELQIREGWAGYKGLNDWGVTMYRIMNQVVKRWDPTRKTTVGQFPARAGAIYKKDKDFLTYLVPPELAQATEVASFNYQSDKYNDYLKHSPHMIVYQSEAESNQWLAPFFNMNHDTMVGLAYWGAVEYWGESNKWPKKGWNYSFFDHTCSPYPQAWLLRSAFLPEEPVVRLGVLDVDGTESIEWNDVNVGQTRMHDYWNFPENTRQQVYTFSNAPQVELLHNGKSLGIRKNEGEGNMRNALLWENVEYGKGGILVAIARDENGKETARHQLETAGKAVRLVVEAEKNEWKADGMDLLYMKVKAVDRKGRIVPTYNEPLTVSVEGAATLLALDNHDHYTDDLFYNVSTKNMYGGRMQIILRSKQMGGKVRVKVTTSQFRKEYKTEL